MNLVYYSRSHSKSLSVILVSVLLTIFAMLLVSVLILILAMLLTKMDLLYQSPDKIHAIKEVSQPTNITELKAYLGLNYYHNLSSILSPVYRLLKKDQPWKWSHEEAKALSTAIELLQSSSLLVHFDSSKALIVSADASPYGLGAVLSH